MRQLILLAGCALAMTATERVAGRYMRDGNGHAPAGDGRREVDPEQVIADLKKSLEGATDRVKEIAENALGKAQAGEDLGKSAKGKADGQPWEVCDAVKMGYDGGDDGIVEGVEEDADEGCEDDGGPLFWRD